MYRKGWPGQGRSGAHLASPIHHLEARGPVADALWRDRARRLPPRPTASSAALLSIGTDERPPSNVFGLLNQRPPFDHNQARPMHQDRSIKSFLESGKESSAHNSHPATAFPAASRCNSSRLPTWTAPRVNSNHCNLVGVAAIRSRKNLQNAHPILLQECLASSHQLKNRFKIRRWQKTANADLHSSQQIQIPTLPECA